MGCPFRARKPAMKSDAAVFRSRVRNRAFGVLAGMIFLLLAGGAEARAQSDERKIEVGAQFSFLRESLPSSDSPRGIITTSPSPSLLPYPINSQTSSPNKPGFGGRVGYNFSSYIAVEGEFNFFPGQRKSEQYIYFPGLITTGGTVVPPIPRSSGHKTEAVFGLKAGGRVDNFGLFAKFRPGLVHFGEISGIGADTNFAMDLGTVIEYYPSRRTLIRVDLSDLMVRFDERRTGAGTYSFTNLTAFLSGDVTFVSPSHVLRPSQTTHNFRLGVGFGFRF